MFRALTTAATGMAAQQTNMDVISNNLANVNTTAFKTSRMDFQDLLYQTISAPGQQESTGLPLPTGIQLGMGVKPISTEKMFSQGEAQQTNNPTDIAIQGSGFFQITMPDSTLAYTRAGNFQLDNQGRLVTADGNPMSPVITVPADATSITIGTDGTVSAQTPGSTTPATVGSIQIVKFINPAGLSSMGQNLYAATNSSGTPTVGTPGANGLGTLQQGALEGSNVQVVDEMVNMILAQRAYEVNSKAIQTTDEMIQMANRLRG